MIHMDIICIQTCLFGIRGRTGGGRVAPNHVLHTCDRPPSPTSHSFWNGFAKHFSFIRPIGPDIDVAIVQLPWHHNFGHSRCCCLPRFVLPIFHQGVAQWWLILQCKSWRSWIFKILHDGYMMGTSQGSRRVETLHLRAHPSFLSTIYKTGNFK